MDERFLVVGGDAQTRDSVAQWLAQHGPSRSSEHAVEARQLLAESWHWDGLVLCVRPEAVEALDVLEEARAKGCPVPAMVLTDSMDEELFRRAQRSQALYLQTPIDPESIEAFAMFANRTSATEGVRMERMIQSIRAAYKLTDRESEILRLVATGIPRGQLRRWLPIKETSIKTHVRRLLRKCGRASIGELVATIHRAVFHAGKPTPYRSAI
jgi:DNA-binding NarL/FixJ family response regulator